MPVPCDFCVFSSGRADRAGAYSSVPAVGLVWGRESFPITAGRINYEYLTAVQRTESHREMPRVPAKQRRVLYYLRSGMTYREIGEIMGISPRTVRYYVSELIHRFHVENRAQLLAASQGLTEKELSGTGEDRK